MIRLPSKLSFLRNLFIPALTPTPLPPGEGLFRIQALASVSCKIVVWKDVYYKLGADSWWFKQGIPATLNFPEYFVLTAKEDKTPLEKAPRENIADKIIDTNDTSFAHQAFPQMGNVACQTHHIIMLGTYSKPLRS